MSLIHQAMVEGLLNPDRGGVAGCGDRLVLMGLDQIAEAWITQKNRSGYQTLSHLSGREARLF
jgi:hypothetical protein